MFRLHAPDGSEFLFGADSEEQQEEWVSPSVTTLCHPFIVYLFSTSLATWWILSRLDSGEEDKVPRGDHASAFLGGDQREREVRYKSCSTASPRFLFEQKFLCTGVFQTLEPNMQMLDRCSFLFSEDRYLARCRVHVKINLCQDIDVCRCLELQESTLPIQVSSLPFLQLDFCKKNLFTFCHLQILVGFVNKSSNDLLSQGNRASITERDSLDGVSVKFSRFFKFHDFKNF